MVNNGSVDCKKTDSLEVQSLTSQACAFSCIMTCFTCAAMVFRYSKRARTCFTKYVPLRSFGSHVTWNSAVPDPDVWCCILLFLCTLVGSCQADCLQLLILCFDFFISSFWCFVVDVWNFWFCFYTLFFHFRVFVQLWQAECLQLLIMLFNFFNFFDCNFFSFLCGFL